MEHVLRILGGVVRGPGAFRLRPRARRSRRARLKPRLPETTSEAFGYHYREVRISSSEGGLFREPKVTSGIPGRLRTSITPRTSRTCSSVQARWTSYHPAGRSNGSRHMPEKHSVDIPYQRLNILDVLFDVGCIQANGYSHVSHLRAQVVERCQHRLSVAACDPIQLIKHIQI